GLGRQRLVHVTGPESFASVAARAGAFRAAAGADAPVLHGEWSEAWGHEAVAQLWAGDTPPDAIFCGNDQIARGVVDALRERGVSVPGEVSVIGFDNWEIVAAATRPPLTTVDMNLEELGREAGRLILELAEGKPVEPGIRKLPCKLVLRQSCGGDSIAPRDRVEVGQEGGAGCGRCRAAGGSEETPQGERNASGRERGPRAAREDIMQFVKFGLLASLALGALVAATPAQAQVTLKVWSIDGNDRPGIADTFSKEFDDANDDIVVEYRYIPFDELVNETLRAFATGNAPDIVSFDNP